MSGQSFSKIASRYDKKSLVQTSAAGRLFKIVNIGPEEDVLDLGCGTGKLTKKIRGMTRGSVTGIDSSAGMIEEAKRSPKGLDITFAHLGVEEMDMAESFDLIFCNSVFQWFKNQRTVLMKCHDALKSGGRMGIQAPAKTVYCPGFIKALEGVKRADETKEIFSDFTGPWIFLETADKYSDLFKSAGFEVVFSEIEETKTKYTPGQTMEVFESGAAAGYLNPAYYSAPFTPGYEKNFRDIVKRSFEAQAGDDGKIDLTFNRIYLLAKKK
ncbi:hypothetical protein MNBD_NITROSPINAE03-467 [hydrothermal vent metagenome]|uniref:Methyltransferase domain-containing protein n=1 Tax=hydrothermal vent metagenome TaxID=652676 RepID=A0A3B1CW32_9ZZZZ